MPVIDSHFSSDVGLKRANNEDAVGAQEPQDARQLKKSGRLYVVADGLGGHQMGERASNYAIETLLKVYFEAPDIPPEKRLRDIIQQINQNLIAFSRKNMSAGEKTATTVVAAVIRNNSLLVANVGDSRAYLIRNGGIRQITHDHSVVGEMLRAGTITESEARQSNLRNRLSRSVGSDSKLEVELYAPIPLRSGDIILLCTDGLTQYASEKDLLEATSNGTSQEIVERLIAFAKEHGGSDNITALAVKYGEAPHPIKIKSNRVIIGSVLGLLLLSVFSIGGWYWLGNPAKLPKSTFTPTLFPSPTLTQTLLPPPTLTQTSFPTQTQTPTLSLVPTSTASPFSVENSNPGEGILLPIPVVLINCEYKVQSGDYAGRIARQFDASVEQIYRLDGSQDNMGRIFTGEILIIRDIAAEDCITGGGIVQQQLPQE